jgi:putative Holliday junction resolvase
MAVDFGERRVGVAVTDPEGRFALPLTTLERSSDRQVLERLVELAGEEGIEAWVMGEPRRLDGTIGAAAERTRRFAAKLEARSGLPVRLVDESLTSREAESRLRAAGIDPRRHPERIDQVAAQILLEQVLGC